MREPRNAIGFIFCRWRRRRPARRISPADMATFGRAAPASRKLSRRSRGNSMQRSRATAGSRPGTSRRFGDRPARFNCWPPLAATVSFARTTANTLGTMERERLHSLRIQFPQHRRWRKSDRRADRADSRRRRILQPENGIESFRIRRSPFDGLGVRFLIETRPLERRLSAFAHSKISPDAKSSSNARASGGRRFAGSVLRPYAVFSRPRTKRNRAASGLGRGSGESLAGDVLPLRGNRTGGDCVH
jgi:hypothetical protein